MAASVAQERATDNTASGTTLSLAFSSNVTAGSAIHVFFGYDHGTGVDDNVTDSQGNAYTLLDRVEDTSAGQFNGHYYAVAGSSGALTVNFNTPTPQDFRCVLIREVAGVSASPLDGHNGNFQSSPGTGSNAVVSGNATNTAAGLMSAASINYLGSGPPTQGTGFTNGITGWLVGTATNSIRSEHKSVSASTQQATFTAAANEAHSTFMAMFKDAAGGGGVTAKSLAALGVG